LKQYSNSSLQVACNATGEHSESISLKLSYTNYDRTLWTVTKT